MVKIVIMRHGSRTGYERVPDARYEENEFDMQIGPLGFKESYEAGLNLMKQINFDDETEWIIYSSPLTRCIQTACEIKRAIPRLKTTKICVDYALTETIPGFETIHFTKSGKTESMHQNFFITSKGRKIKTPIDKLLTLKNIDKRFPHQIDTEYVTDPKQNYFCSSLAEAGQLAAEWFAQKKFNKSHQNILIISHMTQCLAMYAMLTPNRNITTHETCKFGGPKGTNFTTIYDTKKKKLIYGPTRDFIQRISSSSETAESVQSKK